jgi:hypothetical protein
MERVRLKTVGSVSTRSGIKNLSGIHVRRLLVGRTMKLSALMLEESECSCSYFSK